MRSLTLLPSLLALFLVAGETSVAGAEEIDWALDKRISALEKRVDDLERKLDGRSSQLIISPPIRVTVGDFAYDQYSDGRMVLVTKITNFKPVITTAVTTPGVVVRQAPFTVSEVVRYSTPTTTVLTAAPSRTYSPAVGGVITPTPVRGAVRFGITNLLGGCESGRCSLR
jgi:hypothetical protein